MMLPPVLLKNDGGNRYNWIRIGLKGENDNKTGIGTKVEMYAGALRQKWEVPELPVISAKGPASIVAGLGAERGADVMRLLWPTGVLQDEMRNPRRTRTRSSRKSTGAAALARSFSCGMATNSNFSRDMIGPESSGIGPAPTNATLPIPTNISK